MRSVKANFLSYQKSIIQHKYFPKLNFADQQQTTKLKKADFADHQQHLITAIIDQLRKADIADILSLLLLTMR